MILYWTYFISVIYIEVSQIFLKEKTEDQICYSKKLLTSKHKRREVLEKQAHELELETLDSTAKLAGPAQHMSSTRKSKAGPSKINGFQVCLFWGLDKLVEKKCS